MSTLATRQLIDETRSRAKQSGGTSQMAMYQTVSCLIRDHRRGRGGTLLDVGCGTGAVWNVLRDCFEFYIGADIIRYEGFPAEGEFHLVDIDRSPLRVPSQTVDVVTAIEIIEHLENPRAFVRELVRVLKSGGYLFITTPNQLSFLSKLTLVAKNQFNAFQEAPGLYPAHLTALLEVDLLRIARECGLRNAQVRYTNHGRVPFTAHSWPFFCGGRFFSDNAVLIGQRG
jgi:2-polyprenyl-3-methyl-5-hydroxy-6-metoxy-1,4-benzoquinol methylase